MADFIANIINLISIELEYSNLVKISKIIKENVSLETRLTVNSTKLKVVVFLVKARAFLMQCQLLSSCLDQEIAFCCRNYNYLMNSALQDHGHLKFLSNLLITEFQNQQQCIHMLKEFDDLLSITKDSLCNRNKVILSVFCSEYLPTSIYNLRNELLVECFPDNLHQRNDKNLRIALPSKGAADNCPLNWYGYLKKECKTNFEYSESDMTSVTRNCATQFQAKGQIHSPTEKDLNGSSCPQKLMNWYGYVKKEFHITSDSNLQHIDDMIKNVSIDEWLTGHSLQHQLTSGNHQEMMGVIFLKYLTPEWSNTWELLSKNAVALP